VLDGNPAAGFYARLGGRPGARRTVERWGVRLGRTEYRWPAPLRMGGTEPSTGRMQGG